MKTTKFTDKFYLGENEHNEGIWLSAPSWDCGWYWGFGYLGNRNCHYHVSGLNDGKNQNMYDAFKEHFGDSLRILDTDLWTVCELFSTFYTLSKTAEVLGRGGGNYTTNPIQEVITNKDETKRINEVVLPQLFDALHDALQNYYRKEKLFKELRHMVDNNSDIPTFMVIDFMFENKLTTDDLKALNAKFGGLADYEFRLIHSLYWERYHKTKKK